MRKDVVSYASALLFSLFFMVMTIGMAETSVTVINSSLFPRVVLGLMILLSGLGLFTAVSTDGGGAMEKNHIALYLAAISILAFIIVLNYAGFVIAAGLFIALFSVYMMGLYTPRNFVVMGVVGFVVSYGINYIFINILSYVLP